MSPYHVEVLGHSGFPLCILHGWGQSMVQTKPLGELLASHSQVYLWDLPGFGKAPPPEEIWSSKDYASWLLSWMEKSGLEKIDLLGHSFGGKIALSFAAAYPEKVHRLILIGASGLKRKRSFPNKIKLFSLKMAAKGLKGFDYLSGGNIFQSWFVPRFASSDYRQAGPMRKILVKSVNEDLSNDIAAITTPTLLLWGEADTETPLETGVKMHHLIAGSQFYSFPAKGHYLFADCGAHLCASYIRPFLGKP